jgi:hypothetical protein
LTSNWAQGEGEGEKNIGIIFLMSRIPRTNEQKKKALYNTQLQAANTIQTHKMAIKTTIFLFFIF